MAVPEIIPLHLLSAGQSGRVVDVEGDPHLVHRLGEMGLRQGAPVVMVRAGQPCIIGLGHLRLSYRGSEEALVLVEVGSQ
ncbi:MAG: FeoA family protein [Planctomycetaceae bacterium]